MNISDLKTIPHCHLLKDLSETDLQALLPFLREKNLKEGNAVFLENMSGESLYIILQGAVKVSRMLAEGEERILVILGAEDMFGEMAVLEAGPRFATAQVVEDARLLVLTKGEFDHLCQGNPALGCKLVRNIATLMASRIRDNRLEYSAMLNFALNEG